MKFRDDFRIGEPGDLSGFPKDPYILLSYVNTELRDRNLTLDGLCIEFDADRGAIERTLEDIGYVYDPNTDQFKPDPDGREPSC